MKRRNLLQGLAIATPAVSPLILPTANAAVGSSLELAVERYVKEQRQSGRVASNERTAWSVYDMTGYRKLVAINESVPLQAASLVKPFICQAFFFLARYQGYQYGPKTKAMMEKMIQVSDNAATNELLKLVGGPQRCQQILEQYAPKVFRDTSVVEYIPANGRTYQNRASASDYSRFLFALWHRKLPFSFEMLRLMSLKNRDRLKSDAPRVPSSVRVYDKTGTTSRLCGDVGIMVAQGRDGRRYAYTMIGIIEKETRTENYPLWMKRRGDVIRGVSGVVYQHLRSVYPLV